MKSIQRSTWIYREKIDWSKTTTPGVFSQKIKIIKILKTDENHILAILWRKIFSRAFFEFHDFFLKKYFLLFKKVFFIVTIILDQKGFLRSFDIQP